MHFGLNRGQRAQQPPIVRPAIVYDVAGISRWLCQHPDGGWLQTSQQERDDVAKRLLFLSWLTSRRQVEP